MEGFIGIGIIKIVEEPSPLYFYTQTIQPIPAGA